MILHADVAGSTELVQQDKELAHERIQDSFRRFHDTIEKYQGHVLELRGDALLAKFEHAVDAVSAALSFQVNHSCYNSEVNDDLHPTIRVGIAMGEVVIADDTVTGTGVVQAQRVEQLAAPGGVCITAAIQEDIPKRMPVDLENLGEKSLKGFEYPVRVFRAEIRPGESIPPPQEVSQAKASPKTPKLVVGIIVIALVIVGGAVYWFKTQVPREESASIESMAYPLPDKPSIVVLPFTNMSDDPKQEYFVDGMTEDLITDLSKISGLFVIARNSAFSYKGQQVKVRQVAEELGVKYVMEGSVRRAGDEVRINAQLIDAITGGHIWAERYDGSLEDVFAMQDEVTREIVNALEIHLTPAEETTRTTVTTSDPQAHDAFLKGWQHYRKHTPDDFAKAVPLLKLAIELDPNHARARAALAAVYWESFRNYWHVHSLGLSWEEWVPIMARYQQEAMKTPTALAHQVASDMAVRRLASLSETALVEAEQAIALDGNNPAGYLAKANALLKVGKAAEALENVHTAMRLDPHYPASYLSPLASAQLSLGRFQDAAVTLTRAADRSPSDDWIFVLLGAAYGHLGQEQDAMLAVNKANELRSNIGSSELTLNALGDDYRWVGDLKPLREGLVKAGVKSDTNWLGLVTRKSDKYVVEGATTIDATSAKSLYDQDVPFIDTGNDFRKGHIPGAHHHLWYFGGPTFNEIVLSRTFEKSNALVIYGPMRNIDEFIYPAYASAMAVSWGFKKVYYFADGLPAWKAAGFPIEIGKQADR
ncbi:MAG: tetratricopeptide repeat protein [Haliea sp.]|nr:tetratricopeptide repeat protein [Haliea sp.]